MELPDLLERAAAANVPAPPIFGAACVPEDFWPEYFGTADGAEAWKRLMAGCVDTGRPEPVASKSAWEALLLQETVRRGQALFDIDRHPDGTLRDEKERAELRQLDYIASRDDFWSWFHSHGWLENPHARSAQARKAPFLAWPAQLAAAWWFLDGIREGRESPRGEAFRTLLKCRAVGITWLCCHLLAWHFTFQSNFSAKVGSMTGKEVDDGTTYSILGKIRYIFNHQPSYLLPDYDLQYEKSEDAYRLIRFTLENKHLSSVIRGETMNENFGRSGREAVIWQDEFSAVPPRIQEATRTGRTSVAICDWTTSTPAGKGNQFHRDYETAKDHAKLVLRWPADPRRDDGWYDGLLAENGGRLTRDQRLQEYGCSFRGVSGLRIWTPPDTVWFDEGDPEWSTLAAEARRSFFLVGGFDFGDGPSATVFRGALVDWRASRPHEEYGLIPRLWWDVEIYGYRSRPEDIAQDVLQGVDGYRGGWRAYGDPSGKNPLVRDTESWEADLVRSGVPLLCLPEVPFAERYFIDKALDMVQWMMEQGLWRVHRERCPMSLNAEEQWTWDIPMGLLPEQINRHSIKWRKDDFSHFCESGWYGAMAAILYHQPRTKTRSEDEDNSLRGDLDDVYGEDINPWR